MFAFKKKHAVRMNFALMVSMFYQCYNHIHAKRNGMSYWKVIIIVTIFCLIACSSMYRFPNVISKRIARRIGDWKHLYRFRSSHARLFESTPIDDSSVNEDALLSHLRSPGSKVSEFWLHQLSLLDRPVVRSLIPQLVADNALGFDDGKGLSAARPGSFLGFTIEQKRKHPDKVIMMRSGEFYETYGVDALMLINYAGLNPMGNKCKAGCPAKNIQATLDGLTSAGLSVAVYEEIAESSMASTSSISKIKRRALTQIVSPASSTYIYDLCLRSDDIDFRENFPAVGISRTTQGFTLVQIYLDEQRVVVSERLTAEGVSVILAASGAIDPIYAQNVDALTLQSLFHSNRHHNIIKVDGYRDLVFPQQVLRRVGQLLEIDTHSFRISNPYLDATTVTNNHQGNALQNAGIDRRPRPIYTSTALQIGLLPNDNVPSLLPHLLPRQHNAMSAHFWRNWLLHPPPPHIADLMQQLCRVLYRSTFPLPSFQPVSVGKMVALLTAKQCNVALFRDILSNVRCVLELLEMQSTTSSGSASSKDVHDLVNALIPLTTFLCGIPTNSHQLQADCAVVQRTIEAVVITDEPEDENSALTSLQYLTQQQALQSSTVPAPSVMIPEEFLRRNEESFRNKVKATHPAVANLYSKLEAAAWQLQEALREDVPRDGSIEIVHDMLENGLMLREKTLSMSARTAKKRVESDSASKTSSETEEEVVRQRSRFIAYVDRKGKILSKRYTTNKVKRALEEYLSIAESGPTIIIEIMQQLSATLCGHQSPKYLLKDHNIHETQQETTHETKSNSNMVSIVQSGHLAVVLQAALQHTIAAKQRGWALPALFDLPDSTLEYMKASSNVKDDSVYAMHLPGLTPYWLSRDTATANDINLFGLFLLTAPNMSGKSTLMRALLVAALLANCGAFIPAGVNARIPRFDHFFLRTASYDVPSEAKSAFALEMDDVRVVLRDATHKSLVMIDELGKGTSAKDGSALAGALLEHLSNDKQCFGIFATHLHELFLLPLRFDRPETVQEKTMGVSLASDIDSNQYKNNHSESVLDKIKWSYALRDGRCEDSMALVTAAQYHIDAQILQRAEQLQDEFEVCCRPSTQNSSAHQELHKSISAPSTASSPQNVSSNNPCPSPTNRIDSDQEQQRKLI